MKSTKSGNEYTVLSLATQASWKDKKSGEYVNRTEWHRMIAWANLSTFAATLKKGTHLSVEGELRYREFNDKKHKKVKVRLAEIHLGKIGKLDRAEKRDPNAAPPELPPGTHVRSQGLDTGPKAEFSVEDPMANSSMLSRPHGIAPAAFSLTVAVASYGEM